MNNDKYKSEDFIKWATKEGWHKSIFKDTWIRKVSPMTSLEWEERETAKLYQSYEYATSKEKNN